MILLLALGRRAVDAHQFVKGTTALLNSGDPCADSIRTRDFGKAFVPLVKHAYAMSDPDCASVN